MCSVLTGRTQSAVTSPVMRKYLAVTDARPITNQAHDIALQYRKTQEQSQKATHEQRHTSIVPKQPQKDSHKSLRYSPKTKTTLEQPYIPFPHIGARPHDELAINATPPALIVINANTIMIGIGIDISCHNHQHQD